MEQTIPLGVFKAIGTMLTMYFVAYMRPGNLSYGVIGLHVQGCTVGGVEVPETYREAVFRRPYCQGWLM